MVCSVGRAKLPRGDLPERLVGAASDQELRRLADPVRERPAEDAPDDLAHRRSNLLVEHVDIDRRRVECEHTYPTPGGNIRGQRSRSAGVARMFCQRRSSAASFPSRSVPASSRPRGSARRNGQGASWYRTGQAGRRERFEDRIHLGHSRGQAGRRSGFCPRLPIRAQRNRRGLQLRTSDSNGVSPISFNRCSASAMACLRFRVLVDLRTRPVDVALANLAALNRSFAPRVLRTRYTD